MEFCRSLTRSSPAVPVDESFQELIRRVRQGEEDAAAEIVRLYEPEIKRAIRARHTDPRLRRIVDSVDICQAVMANFFVRVASGQFELDHPDQLLRLLVTMARNQLYDQVRRQKAMRRNNERIDPAGQEKVELAAAARQPTPSQEVALQELLQKLRASLTEDERRIAEKRANGLEWAEIAAEEGESPEALRKRLARALDRIVPQFGLSEIRVRGS
jgi:RNA polymerase sigma-70 factor (ECF subfamily)